MKALLQRLKLTDQMITTLPISKAEFVARLRGITDESSLSLFADTFDAFSSSRNEFKGHVDFDGFRIKRRRRFFDTNMNVAVANGSFTERNGELTITTYINGFHRFLYVFYGMLFVIYSVIIVVLFVNDQPNAAFSVPFLMLHALFMCAIPYFLIRRSVKRLKYELEREFFFLTKPR